MGDAIKKMMLSEAKWLKVGLKKLMLRDVVIAG